MEYVIIILAFIILCVVPFVLELVASKRVYNEKHADDIKSKKALEKIRKESENNGKKY